MLEIREETQTKTIIHFLGSLLTFLEPTNCAREIRKIWVIQETRKRIGIKVLGRLEKTEGFVNGHT